MLPLAYYMANEIEERDRQTQLSIDKRILRDTTDPFDLPDIHFRRLFRLNKELCSNLIEELSPLMAVGSRSTRLSIETRVLAALSFFASGNYQRRVGEEVSTSMSQQSISNSIKEVAGLLEAIAERWVKFPTTEIEKNESKARFMENFGMPGVIGIIDGTHIAILKPSQDEHIYFNRKGFHSKNCQIICDANLNILNINANYGGASHDSFIWRQSAICTWLAQNYHAGERNSWLLGDSGYPQQPWLLTPVPNPPPNSPAARYNDCHKRTRNIIERCIGVLKARFRCLLKEPVLRYSPNQVGIIINACAVLHNMCIRGNVPLDDEIEIEEVNQDDVHIVVEHDGRIVRANLINLYFQ